MPQLDIPSRRWVSACSSSCFSFPQTILRPFLTAGRPSRETREHPRYSRILANDDRKQATVGGRPSHGQSLFVTRVNDRCTFNDLFNFLTRNRVFCDVLDSRFQSPHSR